MFTTKSNFKKEFTQRMLERYGVSVAESHISEKYQILGEMVRDYANVDWSDTHTKTIKEDRIIGTIASYNPDLISNKYSELELGELETKSAITYKDKNLNLTHEQIILNRQAEVEKSTLPTLSQYKKLNNL
jgi:hypothetical protein